MAYSTQSVVSDGSLVLLDISIDYLERSEISVYFDSVPTTAWAWVGVSDTQISFSPAVPAGVEVLVKRTTDLSGLRHEFSLGAAFTAQSLDEDLRQVLQIAQEAVESDFSGNFYVDIDMHSNGINHLADPVAAQDAATKNYVDNGLDSGVAAAAASAAAASVSESNAGTSEDNAALSEAAAAASALEASDSETAAAGYAATATTQAGNAATSESNAAASAVAAAASYDSFDDRYLGPKASAPALDNDGNALLTGALYFDTGTARMRVWGGSAWGDAGPSGIIGAISDGSMGSLGFRNKLINGAMLVAQRQLSKSNPADGEIVCDRWAWSGDGTRTTEMSQQYFAPGGEPEQGIHSYLRLTQSAASGQLWANIVQYVEHVRTLNGKVCTLSAWIRTSEDGSGPVTVSPFVLQNFGTGGSTRVDTMLAGRVTNGTFTKYTWTFTMPSIAGKTLGPSSAAVVGFDAGFNRNYTLEITGVQLEEGPVATPFEALPYGAELSRCQRYFQVYLSSYRFWAGSATNHYTTQQRPVVMRVTPSETFGTPITSSNVASVSMGPRTDPAHSQVSIISSAAGITTYEGWVSANAEF